MMMICDELNLPSFRESLKNQAPEAYALAGALYGLGMIDGLRSMALAPCPPGLPARRAVPITLAAATEARLANRAQPEGKAT